MVGWKLVVLSILACLSSVVHAYSCPRRRSLLANGGRFECFQRISSRKAYQNFPCATIQANWNNSLFHARFPTGYDYPYTFNCDIPGGNTSSCSLGDSPYYAVNVTNANDISLALKFAAQHNMRVAIKQTGHDFLGRSTGYASLEIWTHNLRQGLTFHDSYLSTSQCSPQEPEGMESTGAALWAGSAITIGGAYTWTEVYQFAHEQNSIVVGGTCIGVGAVGGYLGGGGGTYGVVVNATVKAFPEMPVTVVILNIVPQDGNDDVTTFLDAIATWYEITPMILGANLGGYAGWAAWDGDTLLAPKVRRLESAFGGFNRSVDDVQESMAPVVAKLAPFNSKGMNITAEYIAFPDYFTYSHDIHANSMNVGQSVIMSSRFLRSTRLINNTALRQMVNVTAGLPGQNAFTVVGVNGGGTVALDVPNTTINPVWQQSLVNNLVARNWPDTTPYSEVKAAQDDITYVKGASLESLAPDTRTYINEAHYKDPNYLANFYGTTRPTLEAIKKKYDPNDLFYCVTCIGSNH
ncbi:FAD-linked oxidoreductase hmp9 [Trichoderma asperellum]|uniref:FAD-linked oxidoreductase hmp9 n=1 Tax=Trichoderma asperellum TaxID=101201 RepID=A0A6V8QWT1_TRIAP|nr:FAD-linked oxidoreductase hmp9 [Trichoderma asperellum]